MFCSRRLNFAAVSSLDISASDRPDPRPPERPLILAIAAAVLLHAAILAWFLFGWHTAPVEEPAPIPVTLVLERPRPPPPPLPPPPAPPKPATPPPSFAARESGPDQRTTAPPAADTPGPTDAAPEPPPGPPAPAPETQEPAPPVGGGKTKPVHSLARLERHEEKSVAHAPSKRMTDREVGEKEETGDPYLNQVWALIEQKREPTTPIGPSGLHLAGISVLAVVIDRGGAMESVTLARSSGSALLDQEARRMVVSAAPFPPLPLNYPAPARVLITINLFPR